MGEALTGAHEIAEGGEELARLLYAPFRRKMAFMAAQVHPEAPAAAPEGRCSRTGSGGEREGLGNGE